MPKKGIGRQLLKYMQKYYKNKGYKKMIIWTIKGLENNEFYKTHGGKIQEYAKFDYGGKMYPGLGFVFNL